VGANLFYRLANYQILNGFALQKWKSARIDKINILKSALVETGFYQIITTCRLVNNVKDVSEKRGKVVKHVRVGTV
jgi:hypothetical protein